MRSRSWRYVWLVVPVLLIPSVPGYAQSDENSAQEWFQRGVSLSRAAQWSEARAAYERSLALEPRVSTYYNLATASLKLQLGRATLLALDEFEHLADPRLHAEFLAEGARMRAEAFDLTGTVILTAAPADATVEVDEEAQRWPVGPEHPITLDPGHHMLKLDAPGYIARSIEVDVERSATTRLSAELSRQRSLAPTPAKDQASNDVWLWGGAAAVVGAAALTIALVFASQAGPERMPRAAGGSLDMVFE